jgi:phosphatidylglycerophosphatase C
VYLAAGSLDAKVVNGATQLWRIVAGTRATMSAPMTIACFDLDGTITHHDTLFPLVLRILARRPLRLLRLLGVLPAVVRFAFDRDRGRLKEALLRRTLRGMPRDAIRQLSAEFVRAKIADGCFADALAAIRRHKDAGHYLVLMSASVDFYVPEFGRQLGFDHVLSTGVLFENGELEGTLTTPNLRGEEKARRFRELVAARGDDPHTFAYGNSESDLPHLRLARHGILVNGSLAARRAAAAAGVAAVDWV